MTLGNCSTGPRSSCRSSTSRSKAACSSAGAAGAGVTPLECASFVLPETAPHARVLAVINGPAQACLNYLAATADRFCLFDLVQRGAVPYSV